MRSNRAGEGNGLPNGYIHKPDAGSSGLPSYDGRISRGKGLFFSRLGNAFAKDESSRKYAVLNADDEASAYFAKQTAAEVITYGLGEDADIRASNISITAQGTSFHVDTFRGSADIAIRMVGKFNVYNAMAAIGAALLEEFPSRISRTAWSPCPALTAAWRSWMRVSRTP